MNIIDIITGGASAVFETVAEWNFFDALSEGLTGLLLMIDAIIYWLIGRAFDLYTVIAGASIFTEDTYKIISNNFLTILGVVMLFYLAYSLLKALVNPDELSKSTQKVVTNVVISLILVAVIPTIFQYAFDLQDAIISEHIIDQIVLGKQDLTLSSVGHEVAVNTYDVFINDPNSTEIKVGNDTYKGWRSLKACIKNPKETGCTQKENFRMITSMAPAIVAGDIDYLIIISTLCGAFLLYIIFSFCLDMGIRVVKLGFYQIISPIPILLRIIPEKKSVFDNWIKATLATYLEVFIRLFVMYVVIFLCSQLSQGNLVLLNNDISGLANVVIILGIFAFGKQAPKLIGDVIGVDSGNMKLGIGGKLAAGGAFGIGAVFGSGATSGLRNFTHGIGNISAAAKNGDILGVGKAAFGTAFSSIAGLGSGAVRGGMAGYNAKNIADMKKAAETGVKAATDARDTREAYMASHDGFAGGMLGRQVDFAKNVGRFMGIGANSSKINRQKEAMNAVKNAVSSIQNAWKDNDGWKTADERVTLARGEVMRYAGDQAHWNEYNQELQNIKDRYLSAGHSESDWESLDKSRYEEAAALAAGITNSADFINSLHSFQDADANLKGLERAIQAQPNKQNQLQGALRTLGANMNKYADMKDEIVASLNKEQVALLNRIDLAKVDLTKLQASEKDMLYDMLGAIKGNATNVINDIERSELFKNQDSSKK